VNGYFWAWILPLRLHKYFNSGCPQNFQRFFSFISASIQDGPKVRRQTATLHVGGLGDSFEVGNPCPETHRYAPASTFLERVNVRLATPQSSDQRARSGMRFSFVSFHTLAVCLCSSVIPYWPRTVGAREQTRVQAHWYKCTILWYFFLPGKSFFFNFLHFTLLKIEFDPLLV